MNAQRAGTADAAAESTSEKGGGKQLNSFANALLEEARDLGHIIGEPLRTQSETAQGGAEETETEQPEEIPAETETETEQTEQVAAETSQAEEEETESETDEETPHGSIEDQLKDYAARGEKPPWYLTRIAEGTRKKNEWKTKAEQAINLSQQLDQENKNLQQQLESQGVSAPANLSDPILRVWNETDIQNLTRECNRWITWATKNPNGGEAVVGKDPKTGEDITKYLSDEEAVSLKLAAEATLRDGIPNRRNFLAARNEADHIAKQIYPDLADANSPVTRFVNDTLRALPALQLVPDIKIWLGHALRGFVQFNAERNGKGKNDVQKKIVQSATTKKAPTLAKTRGFIPRVSDADLDKATKDLQTKGDAEAAEKWLEAKLRSRSKKAERVES